MLRGASDISVSSWHGGAHMQTQWLNDAVAEMKFFGHKARQALPGQLTPPMPEAAGHCSCAQGLFYLFHQVMHLLNTSPVSWWHRRHFMILEQLCLCPEEKHLENFVVGNRRLLQEISLLPDVRTAEPPNLFHSQVMEACLDVHHHLVRALAHGHC